MLSNADLKALSTCIRTSSNYDTSVSINTSGNPSSPYLQIYMSVSIPDPIVVARTETGLDFTPVWECWAFDCPFMSHGESLFRIWSSSRVSYEQLHQHVSKSPINLSIARDETGKGD